MQSDCSNKTSSVQNNSLLLLLNTERLQQIADYDLFIKLFLEAPFVRFRMTYLIIIIDQCIVVITQTFKVDECNFVKTAVIIGTKQLFTSVFLLYGMKINLSTDGQKRTTTSQHKENNHWRPTKNNYLTAQTKQYDVCVMSSLNN